MPFKLVRTDAEEPCKIQLPFGTHLIGRGEFLDCEDKRVSRKHGNIEVRVDDIIIKALHQNPCFYKKKGRDQTEILKQNCTVNLSHGDKFGLLPDSYWYELIHCSTLDAIQTPQLECTQRLEEVSNGDRTEGSEDLQINQTIAANNTSFDINSDDELLNLEINEGPEPSQRSGSPSLLPGSPPKLPPEPVAKLPLEPPADLPLGSPSLTQADDSSTIENVIEQGPESPSLTAPVISENQSTENYEVKEPNQEEQQSPSKRSHSPLDSKEGVKKVKVEPDDVKQEPVVQPGPSGDQGNQNAAGNGVPPSPVKPTAPAPGRERCIYGANCYRKNPAHKAQFAHPSDSDWGTGARGVCPYGAGCQKRDPRHWRDHEHPPGAAPPVDRPANQRRKRQTRRQDSDTDNSEEDTPPTDLIVTGKRARKTLRTISWSGSDDDPFHTDEEDEWVPSENTSQSQYTQDD